MKLCIPAIENIGINSKISNHFGSAPFFAIFDTDTKTADFVANSNQSHAHGTCQPLGVLSTYRPDVVLCRGMGKGAIVGLNAAGVRAYQGKSATVMEVVEEYLAGQMLELTPEGACSGHGCH